MSGKPVSPVLSAEDHLLTLREVAAILRVCRSTLYTLMRTGDLRSLKVRGSRRVRLSAIQAFIREHATRQSQI